MTDGARSSAYISWNIGVESARHGRFQPQGYIATGSEVAGGDWRGGIFDTVALGVGDGWVGSEGGSVRTTKVRLSLHHAVWLLYLRLCFTRCTASRARAM